MLERTYNKNIKKKEIKNKDIKIKWFIDKQPKIIIKEKINKKLTYSQQALIGLFNIK